MALPTYTTNSFPTNDINFGGGLNSTAGPLGLDNSEASDIQNIDFDIFGSILKRNGYTALNTSAITGTANSDGLHWFEFQTGGSIVRKLVNVTNGAFWKMDDLDGTWDDATNGQTITADNFYDFENFLDTLCMTNNEDAPLVWDGAGTTSLTTMTVPTGLTKAKFNAQYNNYLFMGNVLVSGTRHGSRIYWSNFKDIGTWTATDFIDIAKNDGQEITGLKVLADRLVIFKTRSIYNLFFTGDANIPFVLPGGGKSNSSVGCVGSYTIQEVTNGLVFLSQDGFYLYDGNNSYKISDKINTTVLGLNVNRFDSAVAMVQKNKNRYLCAVSSSGQSTNDKVLVWDFFNNSWTIYTGMAMSAASIVYVGGEEERPYWADYGGFVYRGDTGTDDYPANSITAIDAFYRTNWRPIGDLVNQKATPSVYIYHKTDNAVIDFTYSYNLEDGDQYSLTFSTGTSTDVYGVALYGTGVYAGSGGLIVRRDLTGRGRLIRFKFANSAVGETFRIDGFGMLSHGETNV